MSIPVAVWRGCEGYQAHENYCCKWQRNHSKAKLSQWRFSHMICELLMKWHAQAAGLSMPFHADNLRNLLPYVATPQYSFCWALSELGIDELNRANAADHEFDIAIWLQCRCIAAGRELLIHYRTVQHKMRRYRLYTLAHHLWSWLS